MTDDTRGDAPTQNGVNNPAEAPQLPATEPQPKKRTRRKAAPKTVPSADQSEVQAAEKPRRTRRKTTKADDQQQLQPAEPSDTSKHVVAEAEAPNPVDTPEAKTSAEQSKAKNNRRRRSSRGKKQEQLPDTNPDNPNLQIPDPEPILMQTRPTPLLPIPDDSVTASSNQQEVKPDEAKPSPETTDDADRPSRRGRRGGRGGRNQGHNQKQPRTAAANDQPSATDLLIADCLGLFGRIGEVLSSVEATEALVDSVLSADPDTGALALRFNIPVNDRHTVVDALNLLATLLHLRS